MASHGIAFKLDGWQHTMLRLSLPASDSLAMSDAGNLVSSLGSGSGSGPGSGSGSGSVIPL